ncbi:MAG: hypothetical protein NHF87_00180 [Candidatus Shikimatogenerans bostrichidophilus]|nr:MAG: hypothetical protein NHF87_00180 [Candidatus Shikimatogenerans bostrichidophilus]
MKLFLYPLKTKKTIKMLRTYKKYTFILNKKKINKIKLKEYFFKNYSLIVTKINIIKIKNKKKKKIIVNFKQKVNNKLLLNYENN